MSKTFGGYSAADRVNITANERFRLGHVLEPNARFPEWQEDKEFYVHHASDEGLSVAVQEAMSAGLIPVLHDVPMAPELVPKELTYVFEHDLVERLDYLTSLSRHERDAMK